MNTYSLNPWEDLTVALIGTNLDTSSGRVDYNYPNATIAFQSNARFTNEAISLRFQMRHRWEEESAVRLHFHWKQQSANIPNFMVAYQKVINGAAGAIETDYTNHTLAKWDSHAFTYPGSGVFNQISKFPSISMAGMGISDFLKVTFFRDSNDDSELFGASDPSSLVEHVSDIDVHYQSDDKGSAQEYSKAQP